MKNKIITTNISASVKDRLYSAANANNVDFNFLLRQYFQERFLFRLSKSMYVNNFILKGALLFLAHDISRHRPTKDVDFLGTNINNDITEIEQIIKEIAAIDFPDGVVFAPDSIKTEIIKEHADYQGVRVRLKCSLGTVRSVIQLDIGFGDKLVCGPNKIEFPIILDFDPPVIQVYSIVSAIAEKFQAIVSLGLASSRMKDYSDILYFASTRSFKSEELSEAIKTTFNHRKTELENYKYIFNDEYKNNHDLNRMWKAFIAKHNMSTDIDFPDVINKIECFLLKCIDKHDQNMVWNYRSFIWE